MNLLFINIGIHHKNLNALLKYSLNIPNFNIKSVDSTDLNNIDLSNFDVVYSPSMPLDVKKYPNTKFIFGPHFSVFPIKNQIDLIEYENSVYIQPSEWAKNAWNIFPICQNITIKSIPFGVDTDKFKPYDNNLNINKDKIFIYYKRRNPQELNSLLLFLNSKNITNIKIFDYVQKYSEEEYINYLKESKFGVWLSAHESQGFALEEALSSNVPLLVWNVKFMSQEYRSGYSNIPCTTIPYWDNRCGEYFYNETELEQTFDIFINNIDNYKPREYILETLTVEKCGEQFISLL